MCGVFLKPLGLPHSSRQRSPWVPGRTDRSRSGPTHGPWGERSAVALAGHVAQAEALGPRVSAWASSRSVACVCVIGLRRRAVTGREGPTGPESGGEYFTQPSAGVEMRAKHVRCRHSRHRSLEVRAIPCGYGSNTRARPQAHAHALVEGAPPPAKPTRPPFFDSQRNTRHSLFLLFSRLQFAAASFQAKSRGSGPGAWHALLTCTFHMRLRC